MTLNRIESPRPGGYTMNAGGGPTTNLSVEVSVEARFAYTLRVDVRCPQRGQSEYFETYRKQLRCL